MAQADGTIQNDTGSNVRADLNNNIAAAFTNHSGSSAPSTTFAYQWYADTANNLLKIRNGANDGYVTVGSLTTTNFGLTPLSGATFTGVMQFTSGSSSAPGITFSSDTDTGVFRSAANTIKLTLGGTDPFTFTSTAFATTVPITFADGTASAPSVTNTGDTNTGLYFPAADKVGVTTAGTQQYGFDATSFDVLLQNEIRFHDSDSSNYAAVKAPGTISSNYTLTLPGGDGDANQFLKTDGSGALSWASISTPAAVPTGSVFMMATITVPSGYLECDGAAVSRSTYSDLFSAIGETWGAGDGSSTFNTPDLRGEFVRGWASDRRGDGADPASDTGRAFASSQAEAFKEHRHTTSIDNRSIEVSGTGSYSMGPGNRPQTAVSFTQMSLEGGTETRPRNKAMMYVIKT
jgi:microcystin-dependent protein